MKITFIIVIIIIIGYSLYLYRETPKHYTYNDPTYDSATTITVDDTDSSSQQIKNFKAYRTVEYTKYIHKEVFATEKNLDKFINDGWKIIAIDKAKVYLQKETKEYKNEEIEHYDLGENITK